MNPGPIDGNSLPSESVMKRRYQYKVDHEVRREFEEEWEAQQYMDEDVPALEAAAEIFNEAALQEIYDTAEERTIRKFVVVPNRLKARRKFLRTGRSFVGQVFNREKKKV